MFESVQAKILTITPRLSQANEVHKQLIDIGIRTEKFRAISPEESPANISCLVNYIDSTELPPKFPGSIDYSTWYNRPNAYNAWKCHRQMMLDFLRDSKKDMNLSYLLLVEDDAFIYEEEFKKQLNDVLTYNIECAKPSMVYFGWYSNGHIDLNKSTKLGDTTVYEFKGGAGFHGVLLHYSTVVTLLNIHPIGPYDYIAGRLQTNNVINAYAVYPASIIQLDGHSFVEGHHLSKPKRDKI